jgi:transcriptional regulator with XRE-family HTH domain
MISPFGKELRIMRIRKNEVLKDMADKLGCSSSYLSAIELGIRKVPTGFVEKLASAYSLSDSEKEKLLELRELSEKEVSINLQGASDAQKNLALVFNRTLSDLTEEDAKKIETILKERRR